MGRRGRLKIVWPECRAGSSPAPGTRYADRAVLLDASTGSADGEEISAVGSRSVGLENAFTDVQGLEEILEGVAVEKRSAVVVEFPFLDFDPENLKGRREDPADLQRLVGAPRVDLAPKGLHDALDPRQAEPERIQVAGLGQPIPVAEFVGPVALHTSGRIPRRPAASR